MDKKDSNWFSSLFDFGDSSLIEGSNSPEDSDIATLASIAFLLAILTLGVVFSDRSPKFDNERPSPTKTTRYYGQFR